ncbi:organic hydroperoxide resistance protein [Tritonibacter mobilis]|uniref:organic hydroperoxide resistance protein n=1 Tax=Tritonibacter mobilis TaxID=379347 RepID=UPI001C08C8C4|nr:organic hydroperoxide resistance protein [Tritonibacter mobilis]MBU3033232.1 organic hydroperoxide resistance protein [Tritonibacter mobilis]WHQ82417.1 organic hydroperoxide resistance protein [Tritonibacter mobilis]
MSVSPVYTAHASATGGRDGQAKVAGTDLVLDLAPPTEMGGDGKGYNPEQLFAAGYSACYIGAMKFATTQDDTLPKVPDNVEVETAVGIGPREAGGFGLKVHLKVTLPGVDKEAAERLTEAGHKICPYSNSVRGNVDVTTEIA